MVAYKHEDVGMHLRPSLEFFYTGSKLYVMEQFHNYRIVDSHFVVEQINEVQTLANDLDNFGCVLLYKFMARCIIAKLL